MSQTARLPKVLCVDDEPGLLRSLRWLLRGQYEVVVAERAIDGLALLGADDFDVIISDQRMPDMTGTEFLQRAKRVSPRTVRLLLTGYSDFGAVLSSVNDSAVFRFITKPWDNQKLLQTVADAAKVARMSQASWTDFEDTADVEDADAHQATVLVFDTDPEVAEQIRIAVDMSTRVVWTNDIGDAVGRLAEQQIAVLVTDLAGQRKQQIDLIRAVRHNQPRVVVLIYSGERDSNSLVRLINEGQIFRFLPRPADTNLLRHMMRAALTRHADLCRRPERLIRVQPEATDDGDIAFDFRTAAARTRRRAEPKPSTSTTPPASALSSARAWLKRLLD